VQFVFAGKAHPHDEKGKALIRQIVHVSRLPAFRGRIVFSKTTTWNRSPPGIRG